jgi:predicted AAA+ superfamily ATPase
MIALPIIFDRLTYQKMSKAISLNFINTLRERLNSKSTLIQVVLGPRQVGKTTTVLKLLEEEYQGKALYVSADQVFNSDAQWIRAQWITALQEKKILVIDEIQKCFNWAETIKALYDETKKEKKNLQCILLGSSSLEIQKGLSESLTGRFQLIPVHHWNFHESHLGYKISFGDFLSFGGYPGSYEFIKTKDWYDYVKNSIISTVVEKDILQFNKVKNPALFKQAFELLISYPAQEISYTKLLGQLQDKGNVELIKHYIDLYEGAYLIKALEKYSSKPIKTKSSSPKIIPLAPCLSYLHIRAPYDEEEKGHVFESIVGTQLLRTGEEVFYWREGNFEVDFVLKRGKELWAIEVKSGRKKSSRGLDAFKKQFPHSKLSIITLDNYEIFEKDPIGYLQKD